MPEERGRSDIPREDIENQDAFLSPDHRGWQSDRTDDVREDAGERARRVALSRKDSLLDRFTQLAAATVGVVGLRKFLGHTEFGLNLLHDLGRSGRGIRSWVGKRIVRELESLPQSAVRAQAIRRFKEQGLSPEDLARRRMGGTHSASALGELHRIQELEEAIRLFEIHQTPAGQQQLWASDLGEVIRRKFGRPGSKVSPTGHDLLRAGDVLSGRAPHLLSQKQVSKLQQAKKLGIIDDQFALDPNLFVRHSGATPNPRIGMESILDTRWAGRREIAKWAGPPAIGGVLGGPIGALTGLGLSATGLAKELTIPIINFKLADFFKPFMSIMGRHEGIQQIAPGTIVPQVGKLRHGGLLVDDVLFGRTSPLDYKRVGEGFNALPIDENKPLARIYGAMTGHFKDPGAARTGLLGELQYATGVGPAYAGERSVFSRFFVDPVKRAVRGKAELKPEIPLRHSQGFFRNVVSQLAGDDLDRLVPNPYRTISEIPPLRRGYERIKALLLGGHRPPTGGAVDEVLQPGGSSLLRYVDKKTGAPQVPGIKNPSPGMGYAGQDVFLLHKKHRAGLFLNQLTSRVSALSSWLTGIGYRPGRTALGSAARLGGLAYGATYVAPEAISYLDYRIEETTSISPIKTAASAYTWLREKQQGIREDVGAVDAARYMEDLMPGSVTSWASGLSRFFIPPLVGGAMAGGKGMALGLAASALVGGFPEGIFYPESILKSQQALEEEYAGTRKVPIRANRWWEFNAESFTGGRISRFEPSWYAQLMSDYEHTDVLYGSEKNYWQNEAYLPTPSNLFGLRTLFSGDYVAESQAVRRPYPDTVGLGPGGGGQASGTSLGLGGMSSEVIPADPSSLGQSFSELFERSTEMLGAWKFLGEAALGVQSPFEAEVELAHSSDMGSKHRKFWDSALGGLGGVTELPRRVLLPENARARQYNPIPNVMPEWIPGSRSLFSPDTRYILDYHSGDPYAKTDKGEIRLPGPGYEAVHRLHSGIPGVYDPMDRYLILSDIGHHSVAFQHYRTIVKGWADAGVLDNYWKRKYEQTEAEVEAKRAGGRYTHRKFTRGSAGDQIDDINTDAKYSGFERSIGASWEYLTHDIIGKIPYLGSKLLRNRTPLQAYLDEQVHGSKYKDWGDPTGSFLVPHFREATYNDPFTATLMGGMLGFLGGTPVGKATLAAIGGLAGFAGSSSRMALTGQLKGGYVPEERERQWELQEYFDKLKYLRAKRLEGIATQRGNLEAAREYQKEAESTVVGLPPNASIGKMQAAVPTNIKPYFRELMESPPEERDEILEVTPPHIRPLFEQVWGRSTYDVDAEEEVSQYFASRPLPSDEWLGWHPQVPMNISKIKFVESGANSTSGVLHRFGLWEQDILENPWAYESVQAPQLKLYNPGPMDQDRYDQLQLELSNVDLMSQMVQQQPGFDGGMSWGLQQDNTDNLYRVADRMMR